MPVWRGEGDFLALLKADKDVARALSASELEGLFDLGYHLAQVDFIFDRVFGTTLTAEPAENGFAPPDPQPTTEAMASKATPNLIDTLAIECNLNPCALRMQLTEITVGLHLLWLYRRGAVGEVGKIPRLY